MYVGTYGSLVRFSSHSGEYTTVDPTFPVPITAIAFFADIAIVYGGTGHVPGHGPDTSVVRRRGGGEVGGGGVIAHGVCRNWGVGE